MVCQHSVILYGLCVECGQPADIQDSGSKEINISGGHRVRLSRKEAEEKNNKQRSRLQNAKKLILVLDLDHTLLHASPSYNKDILKNDDIKEVYLTSPLSQQKTPHLLKLRPGLAEYLSKMNKLYQMYIYTQGTREYALEVCRVTDEDGIYFGHRILTRTDYQQGKASLQGLKNKNIENLFTDLSSMVVIIDDRADVWQANEKNLVTIKPYKFWNTRDLNNTSGPVFERLKSQENSKVLKHVGELLTWIHKKYYSELLSSNVQELLAMLKRRVLTTDKVFINSDLCEEFEKAKSLLVSLGAKVVQDVDRLRECNIIIADEQTKHQRNNDQQEQHQLVVSTEWLQASNHHWWRESPLNFKVNLSVDDVRAFLSRKRKRDLDIDEITAFLES